VTDIIFALATGRGSAGIAVIRVSGIGSGRVFEALAGPLPEPRRTSVRRIRNSDGLVIDEALCLWFPGPDSFTGEDSVEFHCHGATSVIAALLKALTAMAGCRLAQTGEFSRRAFENGRIDLAAVEGLADLIDSETEQQRRQAVRQMMGGLSREIDLWRVQLIEVLALLEAELDFMDEGDVDTGVTDRAKRRLLALRERMAVSFALGNRGERLREGVTIVLAGPPNAGKSTLLNTLARRDVAIVSPLAGTTRDIVEARLDLDGYAVTLLDTAGMRLTDDPIEQEGVRRMLERSAAADIVLWLNAADQPEEPIPETVQQSGAIIVKVNTHRDRADADREGLNLSSVTGIGVDRLTEHLTGLVAAASSTGEERAVLTRARHREAVGLALAALDRGLAIGHLANPELLAEEVRSALASVGQITGHVGVEAVLDRLFSEFCIGK